MTEYDLLTTFIGEIQDGDHDADLDLIAGAVKNRAIEVDDATISFVQVDTIQAARKQIETATKQLKDMAQSSLKDELKTILSDSSVTNVAWAQKESEYNDQGMSPGIQGPVINVDMNNNGYEGHQWMYTGSVEIDPRLDNLKVILDSLGEEILSEIFGDSTFCTARLDGKGDVQVVAEYDAYS